MRAQIRLAFKLISLQVYNKKLCSSVSTYSTRMTSMIHGFVRDKSCCKIMTVVHSPPPSPALSSDAVGSAATPSNAVGSAATPSNASGSAAFPSNES